MLSRRTLIGKAAVGAVAALAVGSAAGAAQAVTRPRRAATTGPGELPDVGTDPWGEPAAAVEAAAETPTVTAADDATPAPWELLAPLRAGAEVAHGWQLGDLTPVRDGSAVLTLQNARGRAYRIHLCANDGSPAGLVYTQRVDLVVMNQGYGELPTEETLGQAVAAVAHTIAANEARAADAVFAGLLPHGERVRRFAAANDVSTDGRLR